MKIEARERRWFYVSFLASGLCALFFFCVIFPPQRAAIAALARQKTTLEAEIAHVNRQMNRFADLNAAETSLRKMRERAKQELPDRLHADALAAFLEQTAKNSGLDMQSLRFGSPRETDAYSEGVVCLQLEGAYAQTLHFLRDLEGAERFIAIDFIGMKREEKALCCRLELSFYAAKEKNAEKREIAE